MNRLRHFALLFAGLFVMACGASGTPTAQTSAIRECESHAVLAANAGANRRVCEG